MSVVEITLAGSCAISLMALVVMLFNLRAFTPAPAARVNPPQSGEPLVSVCIPARNEEANLEACVRSALAGSLKAVEVLVYDDGSTDQTPAILARLCAADSRVRAVPTVPLPAGWNGKQHGCWQMSKHARGRWMLFTDADVRLAPEAVERTLALADSRGVALISTFPRQVTGSLGEALVVPLIHFILLSYLPFRQMRRTTLPSASAGCGQYLFVRKDAYESAGGHAAFKDSMHDGIKMPRALRGQGYRTDLFDGTELASVRMYQGWGATWRGFTKNAFEGLGSVGLLVFITVLHLVGHVWPWVYLAMAAVGGLGLHVSPLAVGLAAAAVAWSLTQRLFLALRFHQSFLSALLHPVGMVLMTAIQWWSLYLSMTGKRTWRGRTAGPAPATS